MRKSYHHPIGQRLLVGILMFDMAVNALANPQGMTVQGGSATATINGSQLTITTSQNAFLNWQSFNIAAGETTLFQQPSAASIVWNRINDQNPSQIFGTLRANGVVVLLNSSGFYFGPNSFVSAAGLVVSTANCLPPQNSGGSWEFNGPPPLASIVNYGQIQIGHGGSAFLIADKIENHGTISAPGGSVGLAAGQTVLLSERPDGRGMSMAVTLPQGSVDNEGKLIADGGTIAMRAQVVNQNGFIQANSVQNQNGIIELVASDQLNLGADSQILAHGDDSSPNSPGGNVTLKSDNSFSDAVGSQIVTAGGARGGNGGDVEISAPNILSLNSSVDAGAQTGWDGGLFALDPINIVLGNSGTTSGGTTGTIDGSGNGPGTLNVNVNSAFQNITAGQILLEASGNITLNANTTWNLYSSTGNRTSGQLTLEAGGDILFGNNSRITDVNTANPNSPNNWAVTLYAGYDFTSHAVQSGVGNIYLNNNSGGDTGGGSIQTGLGSINLTAGNDILIGGGFVRTTGGGSITATAMAGSVNTGSYAFGYAFSSSDPNITIGNQGTGGISTEAGGDVSITAGQDIISFLPSQNNQILTDAGSGAFGPGNVMLTAGGNIEGHFVVANGLGVIHAGNNAGLTGGDANADGSEPRELALSLASGGWTVNAVNNINLQEVRNPNGIFNAVDPSSPGYHHFNYASDAFVNLVAGNAIQLGDSASLPRTSDEDIPIIFPPILNVSAGAGGVTFNGGADPYNKLILFPSAQGSLIINTTGGGSLSASIPANADGSPGIFSLIVSDSALSQFNVNINSDTFGLTDHAPTPVHQDNPTPIELNISGDMNNVLLGVPEAAQINVVGDMHNSRFQGMNLSSDPNLSIQVQVREIDGSLGTATVHPGLTTIDVGQSAKVNMEHKGLLDPATDASLHVGGNIDNRSEFTTVPVSTPPNLDWLGLAYPPSPAAGRFFYDSRTGQLTFQGALTDQILSALADLTVQAVDSHGQPRFDSQGNPILEHVNVLDPGTALGTLGPNALALQVEYASEGNVPTSLDSGYVLGGGGQFNITARNMDLGSTEGIVSAGPAFNSALNFGPGANINVNLTGDLNMFSTTISSLSGGNIMVNVAGTVNVGSRVFTGNSGNPRGIFTSERSDVTVIAGGDINVNGSRIAAYNGGNVFVESLNGNVNAGSGGSGYVTVQGFAVDPITHEVIADAATIPGSGILATSFPDSPNPVGNILVETPNGSVIANGGGILQLALNQVDSSASTVTVLAGYELHDSNGNAVSAAAAGAPAVQMISESAPGANDLARTVVVNGDRLQVSADVWPMLLTLLGLPSNNSQVINLNVTADQAGFEAAVLGNGAGLASYNFMSLVSAGRNIDASGSGVIGSTVTLKASGDIIGAIFARNTLNISAVQNVNVTALSVGTANVSGGSLGTSEIIGIGGVNVSGDASGATLLSNNQITGDAGSQSGFAQGTAANSASQSMASEDVAKTSEAPDDQTDDEKKKKGKGIALAQKTGHVTVILPPKNSAKSQTPDPGT